MALELLDGMPELIPYGVSHENLKEMNNLAQAWMRVEDAELGMACFRVRVSLEDTAQVSRVEGCHFCLAWDEEGTLLRPLVQPELVFGATRRWPRRRALPTLRWRSCGPRPSRRKTVSPAATCSKRRCWGRGRSCACSPSTARQRTRIGWPRWRGGLPAGAGSRRSAVRPPRWWRSCAPLSPAAAATRCLTPTAARPIWTTPCGGRARLF